MKEYYEEGNICPVENCKGYLYFPEVEISSRGMGTNLFAPIVIDQETRECLQFLGYR